MIFKLFCSFFIIVCFVFSSGFGQESLITKQSLLDSVSIDARFSSKIVGEKEEELTLVLIGRTMPGTYIYSATKNNNGPILTSLSLKTDLLAPKGTIRESIPKKVFDQTFNSYQFVHENDFELEQDFTLSGIVKKGTRILDGELLFQICNRRICSLPVVKKFHINLQF